MAFTPNGNKVVITGWTKPGGYGIAAVEVHDAGTGSLIASLPTAIAETRTISISSDSKVLAVGGDIPDTSNPGHILGMVEFWDLSSNALIYTFKPPFCVVMALAYSPNGTDIAIGGGNQVAPYDGLLQIWNANTNTLKSTLLTQCTNGVSALTYSPDGSLLACSGAITPDLPEADTLEIWSGSGALLATLQKDMQGVGAVAFAPDGKTLWANLSSDVNVYSTANFGQIHSFTQDVGYKLDAISFGKLGNPIMMHSIGYEVLLADNIYGPIPAVHSLAPAASTLTGGQTTTGTVTLATAATIGGVTVKLSSNNASAVVPATLTFPAGVRTMTFTIKTGTVTTAQHIKIGASGKSSSVSATLLVQPIVLQSLTVKPADITAGTSGTGVITLSTAAQQGGQKVTLSSGNPAIVVPESVTIAKGSTSAKFTFTTSSVTSTTVVTLKAVCNGSAIAVKVTVEPAMAFTVALQPSKVKGGSNATAIITLTKSAPRGGLTFAIASSNTAVASPAAGTVFIPAGMTTGTVTINTTSVAAQTTVHISVTLGTTAKSATLTVTP
jgi:WD40 repeat protein